MALIIYVPAITRVLLSNSTLYINNIHAYRLETSIYQIIMGLSILRSFSLSITDRTFIGFFPSITDKTFIGLDYIYIYIYTPEH
jgi:hypothetical protein